MRKAERQPLLREQDAIRAYPKLVRYPDSSVHTETGKRSDSYYRYFVDFEVEPLDRP